MYNLYLKLFFFLFWLILIFIYFQKVFKFCINECLNEVSKNGTTNQRPLQKMFSWWLDNVSDFDSSMCILNLALQHNLWNIKRKLKLKSKKKNIYFLWILK